MRGEGGEVGGVGFVGVEGFELIADEEVDVGDAVEEGLEVFVLAGLASMVRHFLGR